MNKRRGLGRGLEALIPSGEYVEELSDNRARRRFALQIAIAEIKPNPEQPRRSFDPVSLQELADSIRIHGILQPLLVREGFAGYELIAGERRLRAAEIAGLEEVPVIVHPGSGGRLEERLELALVENLQRTDLNAIEEARAIQRLLRDFGLTQEALAERIGKNRVAIAQSVRLLGLPEPAIKAIEGGAIRARATEAGTRQPRRRVAATDPETRAVEEEFRRALGTKVVLTRLKHGGRLTIEFYSNDELESLRRRLTTRS